jgi:hypothetical protein
MLRSSTPEYVNKIIKPRVPDVCSYNMECIGTTYSMPTAAVFNLP